MEFLMSGARTLEQSYHTRSELYWSKKGVRALSATYCTLILLSLTFPHDCQQFSYEMFIAGESLEDQVKDVKQCHGE